LPKPLRTVDNRCFPIVRIPHTLTPQHTTPLNPNKTHRPYQRQQNPHPNKVQSHSTPTLPNPTPAYASPGDLTRFGGPTARLPLLPAHSPARPCNRTQMTQCNPFSPTSVHKVAVG